MTHLFSPADLNFTKANPAAPIVLKDVGWEESAEALSQKLFHTDGGMPSFTLFANYFTDS